MVPVGPRDRIVTRVESRAGLRQSVDPHVVGKLGIPRPPELPRRNASPLIEVDHLATGMHARIGAARSDHARPADDSLEGVLANTLYGDRVGLSLPAAVRGAIVLEDASDAQSR